MTLLVDATTAQHARGIRTVIIGVVSELLHVASDIPIVAAGPDFKAADESRIRTISIARTRGGRLIYQRVLVPFDAAIIGRGAERIDRVLLMDAYLPFLRLQRDVRYAALVHDVLPLTHPQFWTFPKREVKRAAFATLRRSRATIFTSTEHNARSIRDVMLREARVVHFGCGQLTDAEADAALEAPLPTRGSHLVYVGAFEPRKRVIPLVDVLERAVKHLDRELSAVLIGDGDRRYVHALTERVERSPLRESIRIVRNADRETTMDAVRTAGALLLPSIAEGFGLPILEALALGTPVVASDLPEIRSWAGDTILYAAPPRPLEWVEPIATALSSDPRRRRSGQEFAKQYRWAVCAREIFNF